MKIVIPVIGFGRAGGARVLSKLATDLYLKTDLCKLPMTLTTLFIAIPYGILGVSISQLFNVFVSFFINAYYSGKLFGFGVVEQLKQMYPIMLASFLMYLSIIFIEIDNLGMQMFIKVVVGVVVYFSLCWIFKVKAFVNTKNILLNLLANKQH